MGFLGSYQGMQTNICCERLHAAYNSVMVGRIQERYFYMARPADGGLLLLKVHGAPMGSGGAREGPTRVPTGAIIEKN
jgi:hypothetical protein